MKEEFDIIADDEQARKMNEEYGKLGIVMADAGENTAKVENNAQSTSDTLEGKNADKGGQNDGEEVKKHTPETSTLSAMINTPLPVYMLSDCVRYLELAESAGWREPYIDRRKVLR